ncbi:hypothetical protein AVO44_18180 [Ruegeria profundi]|uniref:Uncharacterized protein n=1 Tax=Ruegeria profundi TaxID=1685378 RepID=A0A0X3TN94_9RHOB|nr:hypothetical protein AVO44_18180 [Ruegeria profundi]
MGHETGLISDLALDNDVSTLHRNADPWPGITFDVDRATDHGGPAGHASITTHGYMPLGHTLTNSPATVAFD